MRRWQGTGLDDMTEVGQQIDRAIVFGASGGIGSALVAELVARGIGTVFAAARTRPKDLPKGAIWVRFDIDDERTIAAAAQATGSMPLDCMIVASGVLSLEGEAGPERSYKQVESAAMARVTKSTARSAPAWPMAAATPRSSPNTSIASPSSRAIAVSRQSL